MSRKKIQPPYAPFTLLYAKLAPAAKKHDIFEDSLDKDTEQNLKIEVIRLIDNKQYINTELKKFIRNEFSKEINKKQPHLHNMRGRNKISKNAEMQLALFVWTIHKIYKDNITDIFQMVALMKNKSHKVVERVYYHHKKEIDKEFEKILNL